MFLKKDQVYGSAAAYGIILASGDWEGHQVFS